jgi:type II secretory pathway component PulM
LAFLQGAATRYAALKSRERVLVAALAVLGPLFLGYTLFADPALNRARTLRNTLQASRRP